MSYCFMSTTQNLFLSLYFTSFYLHLYHEVCITVDLEKYLISQGSKKTKLSTSTDSAYRDTIEKQRDYDKNITPYVAPVCNPTLRVIGLQSTKWGRQNMFF